MFLRIAKHKSTLNKQRNWIFGFLTWELIRQKTTYPTMMEQTWFELFKARFTYICNLG